MRNEIIKCVVAVPITLAGFAYAADQNAAIQEPAGIVLKDEVAAPGTVRISKLVGREVLDPRGKDVGKVKDVVLSPDVDRVGYVVLGQAKGLAGMREKLVALPYKAIKFGSAAEDRLYVIVNEDILEKAPGFDDSKWPTAANMEYYRTLDTYYGTKLEAAMKEETPAEAQKAAAQLAAPEELEWSRRATKLHGRNIVSTKGDGLGEIKDLVLDQKTGNVIYAAVEDRHGNLHAVPLNAFTVHSEDKKLVLNTTSDQLKGMPGFDEDHWPAKPDPRWAKASTPEAMPTR